MAKTWMEIGLLVGTAMFVLGTVGAVAMLGLNMHWKYMALCHFYEGSLECMDYGAYVEGEEWTWKGYVTALGIVVAGSGLVYISSTGKRRRTLDNQKAFDLGAKVWIILIVAGFACLIAGHYLVDNVDPFWAWQNWYVYMIADGLLSVVWLLWIVAFGAMFIARSEWMLPKVRSKEEDASASDAARK